MVTSSLGYGSTLIGSRVNATWVTVQRSSGHGSTPLGSRVNARRVTGQRLLGHGSTPLGSRVNCSRVELNQPSMYWGVPSTGWVKCYLLACCCQWRRVPASPCATKATTTHAAAQGLGDVLWGWGWQGGSDLLGVSRRASATPTRGVPRPSRGAVQVCSGYRPSRGRACSARPRVHVGAV